MELDQALEPSSKMSLKDFVENHYDEGDRLDLQALENVEDNRYFVEEEEEGPGEGYLVVDTKYCAEGYFRNMEIVLDAVVTAELSDRGGRYGRFDMADGSMFIYDRSNPDAFIESDHVMRMDKLS